MSTTDEIDNSKEAMSIVCLFLAQGDKPNPPHKDLGFASADQAFRAVADFFESTPSSVKLIRDAFDKYTDSDRVGWDRPLRARQQEVWDKFSGLERNELLDLVKNILAEPQEGITLGPQSLPDIGDVIQQCHARVAKHDTSKEVKISNELWSKIIAAYKNTQPTDNISLVGDHTILIVTPSFKKVTISSQELPQCWAVIPYINALRTYEKIVDELAVGLGYSSRTSSLADPVFKNLPSESWRTEIDPAKVREIDEWIDRKYTNDPSSKAFFIKFLSEKQTQTSPTWAAVSKELSRNDWIESATLFVGGWLHAAAERRPKLAIALALDQTIDKLLERAIDASIPDTVHARLQGGENVIYYGAPGTGKSYAVDKLVGNKRAFRTVFHSDMQNSDFIGTLKPAVDGVNVTYRFQPGTFSKALHHAWNTPDEEVYLIIEEINRAMAAAVFGELFQLLDRDQTGTSGYKVEFPSPEFFQWFNGSGGTQCDALTLPSNLWILATMNSADQGVYPIDTAFRRRWKQIYVPIDYEIAPKLPLDIVGQSSRPSERSWNEFVQLLNEFLIDNLGIAEDRLVGPRFLDISDLSDRKLPGKLLIYLWDDLLRHHERDVLFAAGIRTYGELHKANENSERIFSDQMLAVLDVVSLQTEGQVD